MMENIVKSNIKIKTYLDNVFASLPQTEQTARMKEDIYCSMLDKYNGLMESGTGEDEAFGKVIAEFGSVEDIRAELPQDAGASVRSSGRPEAPEKLTLPASKETERAYEKYKIISAVLIAAAVVLFIFAPIGYDTYESLFTNMSCPQMTNFVFGSMIAVGVMLCVTAVFGKEKYFEVAREMAYKELPSAERVASYRRFAVVRSWLMGLAVGLFVISPFADEVTNEHLVLGLLVAAGVAIIIIVSAVRSSYKDVLGKSDDH